jgi:hypothetical protein
MRVNKGKPDLEGIVWVLLYIIHAQNHVHMVHIRVLIEVIVFYHGQRKGEFYLFIANILYCLYFPNKDVRGNYFCN